MASNTIPLAVPDDLLEEVRSAAKESGLSQADVMCQTMKLGLPSFRKQHNAGRVTNVEPLPDKVLERIYRERDDDHKAIRRMIAAQAYPKRGE